ncbi:MAG: diguanylate cyclase, partial [Clostridia bacterium]
EDAGNNILQLLARAQIAKGYSLDKLHDDLKDGRSGVISFRLDGQYRFAVYEPLDINDWCMFNVIPGEVISAEILAARKSSIVLILVVMSFVLLTLLLIMWREQRNAEGRRTTDARLRSMAERDKLTGLYNRETFVEKARTMIADKPAGSYFMLHCDIDHFKVINDLFGLAAGNTLLCRMAESMQRDIGEKGLCCRITADYFAMLYPNVDTLLEDMPKDYCELSVSGMLPFEITASFGLYVIDDPTL